MCSSDLSSENITNVKYIISPRVAPTEKNIDGLKPSEVLIDNNAKVPGPGVTANTQTVIKRMIKSFNSIVSP